MTLLFTDMSTFIASKFPILEMSEVRCVRAWLEHEIQSTVPLSSLKHVFSMILSSVHCCCQNAFDLAKPNIDIGFV